jgi:3-hydroxymyristoyl/3-hydroxydecanoyl-(acyl carrier protein) dehydratase
VNSQGKSPLGLLQALFAADASSVSGRPHRPSPDWHATAPDHALAAMTLTADLAVFDGHFPGSPILPGVAQVDWAIAFARERFAMPPVFLRLETLKFTHPARVGDVLELEMRWNAAANALQFEYRSDAGRHSGGRIVFGDSIPIEASA